MHGNDGRVKKLAQRIAFDRSSILLLLRFVGDRHCEGNFSLDEAIFYTRQLLPISQCQYNIAHLAFYTFSPREVKFLKLDFSFFRFIFVKNRTYLV